MGRAWPMKRRSGRLKRRRRVDPRRARWRQRAWRSSAQRGALTSRGIDQGGPSAGSYILAVGRAAVNPFCEFRELKEGGAAVPFVVLDAEALIMPFSSSVVG